MPRARASFRISRGSFRALMRQLRTESPSAAVSVAGKRLFRQQRQMRAKPPTGADNQLQRPTPFAQSRHVAVFTVSSGNLRSTVNAWSRTQSWSNRSHRSNSLLTAKITGNFEHSGPEQQISGKSL